MFLPFRARPEPRPPLAAATQSWRAAPVRPAILRPGTSRRILLLLGDPGGRGADDAGPLQLRSDLLIQMSSQLRMPAVSSGIAATASRCNGMTDAVETRCLTQVLSARGLDETEWCIWTNYSPTPTQRGFVASLETSQPRSLQVFSDRSAPKPSKGRTRLLGRTPKVLKDRILSVVMC
jgi:hypothetical protein